MGCDIHLHIEVKIDGKWEHWSAPQISRDYRLFARMANVRNYDNGIEPIAEPRGIPDDATVPTLFALRRMGSDAHHKSWLNAQEFADLIDWRDERVRRERERDGRNVFTMWEHEEIGYFTGNGWACFSRYRDDLPEGATDCRIVFWFDN